MSQHVVFSRKEAMIEELVNKGYVTRAWLGVVITTLNPAIIAAIEQDPRLKWEISVDEGILLVETVQNSPADQAGLKSGDVIVSLGGEETLTDEDFIRMLHASEVGQPVEVKYWRGDKQYTTNVVPIESPRT